MSPRATRRRLVVVLTALCVALSALLLPACHRGNVNKDKADYHYKLGNGFFFDKNTQSAIEELYRALEFDEHHAEAHHLLGFIYFGRRDHVRALKHLQIAVTLDPDFDVALANLGNLYLAMEQWAASVPIFQKLLDKPLYRTPFHAHNNLGWALYNLGQFGEAKRHLEMALFLNPKLCLAYNNLGRVHAHEGQTEKALQRFHKAVELCTTYQEPHYFLGRIYRALAAAPQARKHFQRCLDLGGDTPYGQKCSEAL